MIDRIRGGEGGDARPRRKRDGSNAAVMHFGYTVVFFGVIRLIYLAKNRE